MTETGSEEKETTQQIEGADRNSSSLEAEQMRRQAAEVRDQLKERNKAAVLDFPAWKKLAYFVILFGSIVGAFFLLVFQNERQAITEVVLVDWLKVAEARENRLIQLPPPPPKEEKRTVRTDGPIVFSTGEPEGVLYSDIVIDEQTGAPEEDGGEGKPAFVAPPKTEASRKAYEMLIEKSDAAAKIVNGGFEAYAFVEWTLVREAPPVFYIDLLVTRQSDQQQVHMTWEVNVGSEEVRPLSQAARDVSR